MLIFLIILSIISFLILFFILTCLILTICAYKVKTPWNTNHKPIKVDYGSKEKNDQIYQNIELMKTIGSEVGVTSFDGLTLKGRYIIKKGAKRNVILFHGYRGNPYADFASIFPWLLEEEINILFIYQRGCLPSEGKYITMGIHESKDVITWVNYINSQNSLPITLWGISMGASGVVFSLQKGPLNNVKSLIIDCGFSSPYLQFYDVMRLSLIKPIAILAINFSNLISKMFFRLNLKQYDGSKILTNNEIPTFFSCGDKDKVVKPYHTKRNFEANKGEKKIIIVKDAGHLRSFYFGGEEYKKTVKEFLYK